MIHDGQFTLAEYERHLGWGHSPVEFAVDLAIAQDVRKLALYHHDPMRDDAAVDQVVEMARRRAEGSGVEVFAAAEGMTIELERDLPARDARDAAPALQPRPLPAPTDRTALIATDPEPARVLKAAIADLESAILGWDKLIKQLGENPVDMHRKAVAGLYRGRLQMLSGQRDAAVKELSAAVKVLEGLVSKQPDIPMYRYDLGRTCMALGQCAGDPKEAAGWYVSRWPR